MAIKKPIRPSHGIGTLSKHLKDVLDRQHQILDGGINHGGLSNPGNLQPLNQTNIGGNVDNTHVVIQAPAGANTEFAVTHNLGRIPTGYHVVMRGNPSHLYVGPTAWTKTQIFLKADLANASFVLQIY
jgi:hypothetical protein